MTTPPRSPLFPWTEPAAEVSALLPSGHHPAAGSARQEPVTMTASKFGAVWTRSNHAGAARREAIAHPIAVTLGGELAGTWTPVGVSLDDVEMPNLDAGPDWDDEHGDAPYVQAYHAEPQPVELARLALEIAELRSDFETALARLTRTPVDPNYDREAIARRANWANVRHSRGQAQLDTLLEAVREGIDGMTTKASQPTTSITKEQP